MAQAGDIANPDFIVRSFQVDSNQSIERGDVIVVVDGRARKATENDSGPFAIAIDSINGDSANHIRACISGLVYVIAGSNVKPFRPVKVGLEGRVVEDQDSDLTKRVGIYIGKENEYLVGDAHNGEVILIKLG